MVNCTCGLFSSDFSVKLHPTPVHWDLISPTAQLKDVLFLFAVNVPLAELTDMLWDIILREYKFLSYNPRFKLNRVTLQYTVIAGLIQFAHHLVQIPDFPIDNPLQTITEPPLCFTVGGIKSVAAFSPANRASNLSTNFSIIYSSVQRTFFHFSIVPSLCVLSYLSLLTLSSFLQSILTTSILAYRSASQSLLQCWHFFMTLVHLCNVV